MYGSLFGHKDKAKFITSKTNFRFILCDNFTAL